MKKYAVCMLLGIGVMMTLFCATGEESAADKAYDMAKKTSGDTRRTQLKTAYINYRKAVMANPDKVSTKLRNRFLEMCITRAYMVLNEGRADMDAIPLLIKDIDGQLKDDAQPELRQQYAAFLVQLGDTSASDSKGRYIDALEYYDKAIEKAADPAPFKEKRGSIIRKVAEENYEMGMMEFEMGKNEKSQAKKGEEGAGADKYIRAEYFAKTALYFDSTFDKAQKLLSDCYVENLSTYSAFKMVVTDYADTLMFRNINKYDILLAIFATKGTTFEFRMHNNSWNALRMKSNHFSLVDVSGKKYTAAAGQKMEPDLLDQEREATYKLTFPATGGAKLKKLIYENDAHYTEKNFF